jgi:hypothetical protein
MRWTATQRLAPQGPSAATLAAREKEARAALSDLRDRSREIERICAAARAGGHGPEEERVRRHARALTTEAARLRVELRSWNIASPHWVERVRARLDQLAEHVETAPQANRATVEVSTPAIPERTRLAADQVERTVYDYLCPRRGAAPALG